MGAPATQGHRASVNPDYKGFPIEVKQHLTGIESRSD